MASSDEWAFEYDGARVISADGDGIAFDVDGLSVIGVVIEKPEFHVYCWALCMMPVWFVSMCVLV